MMGKLSDPRVYIAFFGHPLVPFVFCKTIGPQPDNIRGPSPPQEMRLCVRCARTFDNP